MAPVPTAPTVCRLDRTAARQTTASQSCTSPYHEFLKLPKNDLFLNSPKLLSWLRVLYLAVAEVGIITIYNQQVVFQFWLAIALYVKLIYSNHNWQCFTLFLLDLPAPGRTFSLHLELWQSNMFDEGVHQMPGCIRCHDPALLEHFSMCKERLFVSFYSLLISAWSGCFFFYLWTLWEIQLHLVKRKLYCHFAFKLLFLLRIPTECFSNKAAFENIVHCKLWGENFAFANVNTIEVNSKRWSFPYFSQDHLYQNHLRLYTASIFVTISNLSFLSKLILLHGFPLNLLLDCMYCMHVCISLVVFIPFGTIFQF